MNVRSLRQVRISATSHSVAHLVCTMRHDVIVYTLSSAPPLLLRDTHDALLAYEITRWPHAAAFVTPFVSGHPKLAGCWVSSPPKLTRIPSHRPKTTSNIASPHPTQIHPMVEVTMTTRRKIDSSHGSDVPLITSMPGSTIPAPVSPARRSPFLPTRLEAQLIAIYPATLFLGSIISILSPAARAAPYSADSQSHPPEFAPSYFALKKNIFNVYFVKFGWFWTTIALAMFVTFHPGFGRGISTRRVRAGMRYATVTTWWFFLTQWCFGPPLIDRGFRFTGGMCALIRDPETRADLSDPKEFITAATCKAVGGTWKGGHDISGHVFLLILGSALLWLEFLPALTRMEGLRDGRLITLADGKVASVIVEKERVKDEGDATAQGVKFALGVAGLMWWMLLMTAAYFHTWFEKFTGLLVAFVGLWTVYFLPRGVPQVRVWLGMPGV